MQLRHSYQDIISVDNLLAAWQEFIKDKRNKLDVQDVSLHLMDTIISLHEALANHRYRHGGYTHFKVSDPKPRDIHKASVRDRLLHHALYRILYPFFERTFVADSFSCRVGKGTHKALNRFREFSYKVSRNNTRTAWVLKGDIKKFFASIDQAVLIGIMNEYIPDQDIRWLIGQIIDSFHSTEIGKGLPLGNLTSQLFVNVYMNKFDQFIKHKLKVNYYIRYADDFVVMSEDRQWLESLIGAKERYLTDKLTLTLHPNKVSIKTLASGVDYLGWVHFPHHRVLRTSTMRRMMVRISEYPTSESFQSNYGLLKHGDAFGLQQKLENSYVLLHNKSFPFSIDDMVYYSRL